MRSPSLLLLAALASACGSVASIESAIALSRRDSTPFEPRLLGTWEYGDGARVDGRLIVTRSGTTGYVFELTVLDSDSTFFFDAITGTLGPDRLLLELSPIRGRLPRDGSRPIRDSIDHRPPDAVMLLPIKMQFVIETADSGLRFFVFDTDSLLEALTSGRITTPYLVHNEWLSTTLLLTSPESDSIHAALQQFAGRPGALTPWPRTGHFVELPDWK